jgi:hypothetical protein
MNFKPKTEQTPFTRLVQERTQIEKEWRALNSPAGFKLSRDAFLNESMRIAGSNPERLKKLREQIAATGDKAAVRATLERLCRFIKSPNCGRPTKDLTRLTFLTDHVTLVELVAAGSSTFELFSLAVQIVGEKWPECFGVGESSRGLDEKLLSLATRRDVLDKQIAESFAANDLFYHPVDPQGKCVVAFKIGDGKIPVHPPESAGERLANFLMNQTNQP